MAFPKSRILTTKRFIQLFHETKDKQRFCFILGAGASVDSKIKAGNRLEMIWMDELMGKIDISPGHRMNPDDTRRLAKYLYDEDEIEHNFDQIEKAWEIARIEAETKGVKLNTKEVIGPTLSSEYYFDLYKLRFHPNPRNGYRYLEDLMETATPSLGYHALALTLTKDNRHNLVITTNFDSLTEDALFLYTPKRPLVVSHESLATYIDSDMNRPIIAKVHRGLMFDPFNSPETTDHLQKEWQKSLDYAFKTYTPIVIGYGGGDGSLMAYLKETELSKGIYWCYMEEFGLPGKDIQKFVRSKNGCFVKINGFDKLMMELGKDFYPDDIGPENAAQYLTNQSDRRYAEYLERWTELNKDPDAGAMLASINKAEQNAHKNRAEADNLTYLDHFNLAYAAAEKGDLDVAIGEYTKAIERDPDRPVAYNNRGNIYVDLKQPERAIQDYDKAIKLDPNYAAAYYNRGLSYYNLKQCEQAIQDYDKAIGLNPNDADTYIARGNSYSNLKQYVRAIQDCDKAIELDPNYALAYYNRGNSYVALKQYERAIQDYDKAIELDPNYAAAYNNRGNRYADLKQYERAIRDYDKAIELDPNYAFAYNNRGLSYHNLKQYERAIQDYDRAIELDPNDAAAYIARGISYHDLKQYERAIQDYDKAIELDPNYAAAYNNRAFNYAHIEEFDKAISDVEKSLSLNPDEPTALHTYGFIHLQQKHFNEAIDYFSKALSFDNELKDAYEDRAKAYRAIGETALAEADEAKAAELEAKQNKKGNP